MSHLISSIIHPRRTRRMAQAQADQAHIFDRMRQARFVAKG